MFHESDDERLNAKERDAGEALLRRLAPHPVQIDRDRFFFAAGEASAQAKQSRGVTLRRVVWPAVAAALALVATVQTLRVEELESRVRQLATQNHRQRDAVLPKEHARTRIEIQPETAWAPSMPRATQHQVDRYLADLANAGTPRAGMSNMISGDATRHSIEFSFAGDPARAPSASDTPNSDSRMAAPPKTYFELRAEMKL